MQANSANDPQTTELEVKDLLLPLVGALWVFTTLAFSLVQALNGIRDKVLTGKDAGTALEPDHRLLLLENDWLPLTGAFVIICLLFMAVTIACYGLVPERRRGCPVKVIFFAVALVSGGIGVLWLLTTPRDVSTMRAAIASAYGTNTPVIQPPAHMPPAAAPTVDGSSSASLIPPFKAEIVAVSHSAIAGVMAAFALAGLFLLVERKGNKDTVSLHSEGIQFLFVAFLTGGLASYLFSTITGDPPIRAYFLFQFGSVALAFHVFTLLTGIWVAFNAFEVDVQIVKMGKIICVAVVCLCVTIIGSDFYHVVEFLTLDLGNALLAVTIASCIWFMVLLGRPSFVKRFSSRLTASHYCSSILGSSLAIVLFQGLWYNEPDNEILNGVGVHPPTWLTTGLFLLVVLFGAWTIRLILVPRRQGLQSTGVP